MDTISVPRNLINGLLELGVTLLEVKISGQGDDGFIDEVWLHKGDAWVPPKDLLMSLIHEAAWEWAEIAHFNEDSEGSNSYISLDLQTLELQFETVYNENVMVEAEIGFDDSFKGFELDYDGYDDEPSEEEGLNEAQIALLKDWLKDSRCSRLTVRDGRITLWESDYAPGHFSYQGKRGVELNPHERLSVLACLQEQG